MKDYLRLWGFYEKDYTKPLDKLNLSKGVLTFLRRYIEDFPSEEGIVFQGPPKLTARVMASTIKTLYDAKKFKNRVSVIDVPSFLLQFSSVSFEARAVYETKLLGDLNNSDLVVFQEIGLTEWTPAQCARLYILLQQRYSRRLPFFCTVSTSPGIFEQNVGSSNFFRVSDHCTFLEISDDHGN